MSKESRVSVMQTCKLPISIKKSLRGKLHCDVIDMNVCYILLGRPWQLDNDVTYIGRGNILFLSGESTISLCLRLFILIVIHAMENLTA